MKRNRIFSFLLSLAIFGGTLPSTVLAMDSENTTGDKTVPGYVDDNNGHPKKIQKTFDFVDNNIAYTILDDGVSVEVSPWFWKWEHHTCDQGHNGTSFVSTEYTGQNIVIPKTVKYNSKTYNVAGIGNSAFWNASGYTVTFPESEHFKYIGNQVFFQTNPNMDSITIPASVTHIGSYSFALNNDSKPVTIPPDSKLEVIGDYAFANNWAITELYLPNTLTTIGNEAFSKCTKLNSITIPASVTTMDTRVFDGFYDPTKNEGKGNVNFAPGSVFKIQDGVFYDDENLIRVLDWQENVVVPEGIKYIGDYAFYAGKVESEPNTLKSITFPSTLVSIGEKAFSENKALKEVVIPENVKNIGENAFESCSGLEKVDINTNITVLPNAIFNGCSSLKEVELPNTIKTIETSAFGSCESLDEITLPTSLETIGDMAFKGCTALKTVVIPDGVTTISSQAFGNCASIETVILPASIQTVGKQAFQKAFNPQSATFIILGNDPKVFDKDAFGTKDTNKPNKEKFTVIIPAGSEAAFAENTALGGYVKQENDETKPDISYSLSIPQNASVYIGKTIQLNADSKIPKEATLTWSSDNTEVATVSNNGTITGVKAGSATITASIELKGAILTYDTCTVTVSESTSGGGSSSGGDSTSGTQFVKNAVYRAYNPNSGEHFYTPSYEEFKFITNIGWDDEGIACMTETQTNGHVLYRLYNPNSGLHHYTLDETEKNILVSLGWDDEGVAWYTSKNEKDAAVYRLYNQNDGQHHYTMDAHEKDVLVSLGWDDEGIGYRSSPIKK